LRALGGAYGRETLPSGAQHAAGRSLDDARSEYSQKTAPKQIGVEPSDRRKLEGPILFHELQRCRNTDGDQRILASSTDGASAELA
jgi:hypothetical protein